MTAINSPLKVLNCKICLQGMCSLEKFISDLQDGLHELIFFDDHVHFPLRIEALHALGQYEDIILLF
jgi:hypothetical protein